MTAPACALCGGTGFERVPDSDAGYRRLRRCRREDCRRSDLTPRNSTPKPRKPRKEPRT